MDDVFSILKQEEINHTIEGFRTEFLQHKVNISAKSLLPQDPFDRSTLQAQPSCSVESATRRSSSESQSSTSETTQLFAFVCVKKNNKQGKDFLKYSKEKELTLKEKIRNLSRCLAAIEDAEMKVEAYKYRAELLWKIDAEDLALLDVNRALALKPDEPGGIRFSSSLEKQLRKIRNKAKKHLKNRKDYRRMAIEYCFDERIKKKILKFSRKIREPGDLQKDEVVYENFPHTVWTTFHQQQRPLSSNVEISYDETNGWHWRAKNDISAGDTLSIEEYFALKLSAENMRFYCSYCTIWSLALIPCDSCQTEMYCSYRCRDAAWIAYHRTECKLLKELPNLMERELTLLALRIFLTGTQQGLLLLQIADEDLGSDRNVYDGMYKRGERPESEFRNDYRTVLTLMWRQSRGEGIPFSELLPSKLLIDIIEVFVTLRRTGFFSHKDPYWLRPQFSKEEMLAIVLLVHNAALLSYNHSTISANFLDDPNKSIPQTKSLGLGLHTLHSLLNHSYNHSTISANFLDDPNKSIPQTKSLGLGLHTLHSLLNHSCNPQAALVRDRRKELVYAVRNISKGEQIYISYVGDYGKRSYQDRWIDLKKRYNMTQCPCETCEGDIESWSPWKIQIQQKESNPIPMNRFQRYIKGLNLKETEKNIAKFHERFQDLAKNPTEDSLKELLSFQQSNHRQVLKNSSQTAWFCEYLIKKFMSILRGNFQTPDRLMKEPPLQM